MNIFSRFAPIPFLAFMLFALACAAAPAGDREKVILDSDMVEGFDDGVAMVLLARAPNIDLLGVTTVFGNSWVAEGTSAGLRQLEMIGRRVPVFQGVGEPIRPQRHELFELERKQFGMGEDAWVGWLGSPNPGTWDEVYRKNYKREPSSKPDPRHAVDFIIDTVRANPGQVTIVAIGTCGNLAMAVRKAPDIVPLVKRVVYMGGSFFKPGNVTPAAEFNWWADPEAARMTVRSAFKEQVVVGLDVCEKVLLDGKRFKALMDGIKIGELADMWRGGWTGATFAEKPESTSFVWDLIAAAIVIDPTLVTGGETLPIDVNADFGLSYGQAMAFRGSHPAGSQPARIITEIDQERFWKLVMDPVYWKAPE